MSVCVNCDDTDKCMLYIRYKQTLHVTGVLHIVYRMCVPCTGLKKALSVMGSSRWSWRGWRNAQGSSSGTLLSTIEE